MMLQRLGLHFGGLLAEDDRGQVSHSHVLFQRWQIFKANRRLAVGAPKDELTVVFDDLLASLLLLVLLDDLVEE